MEFFKIRKDIPFMRHALAFNVVSLVTFLLAVFFLYTKGLNFSIEFTGGTVLEVNYEHAAEVEKIRGTLDARGYRDYSVQNFGSSRDVLIRMPLKPGQNSADLSKAVMEGLAADDRTATLRRVEFVGPQVGRELAENGALALLITSLGIVGYLALRFEWKFGVAAIIANLHDVVVIADRIRENFRKMRKATVTEIIDNAITRTISRTIITHGCTQTMVTSMLVFGGPALHYFALALTIGILFGIYSSVLVMAPIVRWLGIRREDLVKPLKEKKQEAVI